MSNTFIYSFLTFAYAFVGYVIWLMWPNVIQPFIDAF